jgi:fibronectin-binding autotransporter adhesin
LMVFFYFAATVSTVRAAISYTTVPGGIFPEDPNTWDGGYSLGYIGYTADGAVIVSDGSNLHSTKGYLGCTSGVSGTVTVDGDGSTWTGTFSLDLYIGDSGSGTLTITNGGSVGSRYVQSSAHVGYRSGSMGLVIVDGLGSKWETSGPVNVFHGAVSVTRGGFVTAGQSSIGGSGLAGTVTVDGPSSKWKTGGSALIDGSLNVVNGGTFFSSNGSASSLYTASIGASPSATGEVTISGSGSNMSFQSTLHIADSGTAIANITDGGRLSGCSDAYYPYDYSNSYVGYNSGSSGVITVSGNGSTWDGGYGRYIGHSGSGTLNITNGGLVTSNTPSFGMDWSYDSPTYLGYYDRADGTVVLDGTASRWINKSDLFVGYSGKGTVNQHGGTNSVAKSVYLGSQGIYNLCGGVLELSGISGDSGASAFNVGNGTLRALHAFATSLPMTLTGDSGNATVDTADYALTLSGQLSGLGGLNKLGTGTLTLSGNNAYRGSTTVSTGTLNVANVTGSGTGTGAVSVESGAMLMGSGNIAGPLAIAGTLSPGNSAGVLSVNNQVAMQAGSTFKVELNGLVADSGYNQLLTTGPVSLAGSLATDFGVFTPTGHDVLFVISNTGSGTTFGTFQYADDTRIGTFNGHDWYITYDANNAIIPSLNGGNDVAIYSVPELSSLALVGVAVACLLVRFLGRDTSVTSPSLSLLTLSSKPTANRARRRGSVGRYP